MNKREVFISLPMNGKTEEEILEDIQKAKKAYLELSGENIREVAFVDNLERGKRALQAKKEDAEKQGLELILPEPERMGVWYLGIALNNIAYCERKKYVNCMAFRLLK